MRIRRIYQCRNRVATDFWHRRCVARNDRNTRSEGFDNRHAKPFKPRHENQPLGTAHDFSQFFATQTTGIVHAVRLRLIRGPHPSTDNQQFVRASICPVQPKRLKQAVQVFARMQAAHKEK